MSTITKLKLLPCPFCGGDVKLISGFAPLKSHFIDCEGCKAASPLFSTAEEAIAAWNRRTAAQGDTVALQARIAEAESIWSDMAMHLAGATDYDEIKAQLAAQGEPSKSVDASEREFITKRLRRVAKIVGLESAIPGGDDLLGCAGSVLGMIASKLERQAGSAEQVSEREAFADWMLNRADRDTYVKSAWEAWQAHAALQHTAPAQADEAPSVPEGLVAILREAAWIIEGTKPSRGPIVDELEGFAAMLAAALTAPPKRDGARLK